MYHLPKIPLLISKVFMELFLGEWKKNQRNLILFAIPEDLGRPVRRKRLD
jgi:hypothetical protein